MKFIATLTLSALVTSAFCTLPDDVLSLSGDYSLIDGTARCPHTLSIATNDKDQYVAVAWNNGAMYFKHVNEGALTLAAKKSQALNLSVRQHMTLKQKRFREW